MNWQKPLILEHEVTNTLRSVNNLGKVFLNNLVLRLFMPAAVMGLAMLVRDNGWGLLNRYEIPSPLTVVLSMIAMDFFIWVQQVLFHAIPVLWRLHRLQHADLDDDITTGARFQTIEIILSMLIKFATIVLLGPPVVAVVIFEVLLNATAMFNHSNVKLPARLDRLLRWVLVTPDMHRVHHSVEDDEANSNFGFSLTGWDRLFGTYRDSKLVDRLPGMLALPFVGPITGYAINRRQWNSSDEQ